jgi:hypothetical protein
MEGQIIPSSKTKRQTLTQTHAVTVTDYLYLSIQIFNVHSPIAIQPLLPPTDSEIRDTVPANVHTPQTDAREKPTLLR